MNTALPIPLAALPEHPGLTETLGFQLNGLMVVFLVLGSIWFLLEIIGKAFALRTRHAPPPAKTPAAQPPPVAHPAPVATGSAPAASMPVIPSAPATPAATVRDDLTPETVALIATAVHLAVGARHRIVAISPLPVDPHWALEGRRQIFASHRPR